VTSRPATRHDPVRSGAALSRAALTGAAAALVGVLLGVAGCGWHGTTPGPSAATTGSGPTTAPASPTGTPPPAGPLVVDVATVHVGRSAARTTVTAADGVTAKRLDDATTRLVADLPASDEGWRVTLSLTAPRGTTVETADDGTLGVVGTDGRLRFGLAAPADGYRTVDVGNLDEPFGDVAGRHGVVGDGPWQIDDPDPSGSAARTVTVSTPVAPPGAAGSARRARADRTAVLAGTRLLRSASWEPDGEGGGGSWVVTPTRWGRLSGTTGRSHVFAELVALQPETGTDVIENQLLCHVDGAISKSTWNLEPWRPDVSYLEYLLARCNPT